MSMNNFGDTKGSATRAEDTGLGGAGSGILGGYAFCTSNAGDVGSTTTWDYPAWLLPEKKKTKTKNPIRIHKGSLNEKR